MSLSFPAPPPYGSPGPGQLPAGGHHLTQLVTGNRAGAPPSTQTSEIIDQLQDFISAPTDGEPPVYFDPLEQVQKYKGDKTKELFNQRLEDLEAHCQTILDSWNQAGGLSWLILSTDQGAVIKQAIEFLNQYEKMGLSGLRTVQELRGKWDACAKWLPVVHSLSKDKLLASLLRQWATMRYQRPPPYTPSASSSC